MFYLDEKEMQQPNGQCAGIRIKWSRFESWPASLHCDLGQDTSLSQCHSLPRCINNYTGEFNAGGNLRWISIPSRMEQKYFQSLNATKPGISASCMCHWPNADFTFKEVNKIWRCWVFFFKAATKNQPSDFFSKVTSKQETKGCHFCYLLVQERHMWHDLGTEVFCRAASRALQALQDGWQYLKIQLVKASYTYLHAQLG